MNDKSKSEKTTSDQVAKKAAPAKPVAKKPTIKARKPISKEEYARTSKVSPDSTSVIPVITDDQVSEKPTEPESKATKSVAESAPVAAKPVKPTPKAKSEPKVSKPVKPVAKESPKPATKVTTPATPPVAKSEPRQDPDLLEDTTLHKAIEDDDPRESLVTKTAVVPAVASGTSDGGLAAERNRRRKLRRKLTYVEPWSVTKMAFVVSVALMIVLVVASVVFWFVLQVTGVWDALNDSVINVLSDGSSRFDINDYVGLERITGLVLIVSAFNVIFSTALATIGAHLYNLAAAMMGGVEVTFEE